MGIKTLSKHKTSVTFKTLFIEVKSQSNQKVMAKQTFLTTLSIASVFKTGRYKFKKKGQKRITIGMEVGMHFLCAW